VFGIANESSIAYGCAKAFRELDADLAITYLNENARSCVEPIARDLQASLVMPLDVSVPGQLRDVFETNGGWVQTDAACAEVQLRGASGGLRVRFSLHWPTRR
jgi:enoyl-[acyl-carrier protein] reductase I